MASIELRTPKNKPAYYKITANITLNGRTIRKFSRFEFDPKTLKTAKQRTAAATAAPTATAKSQTRKIDSKHTISVTAPEGAEVYLDNVYKGIVPCKFTKVIGSQTITLSKTGYETKSYSIDILDDDKNAKLSFSDLIEDADK